MERKTYLLCDNNTGCIKNNPLYCSLGELAETFSETHVQAMRRGRDGTSSRSNVRDLAIRPKVNTDEQTDLLDHVQMQLTTADMSRPFIERSFV